MADQKEATMLGMSKRRSPFVLTVALVFCFFGFARGQAQDIPVRTVCEVMKDLLALDGKIIIVVGRLASTMEGAWLDQTCPDKLVTDGYEWSTSISLSYVMRAPGPPPPLPKTFRWDKTLLAEKLSEVKRTTTLRHPSEKWTAIYGRIETGFPLDGMLPPNVHIAPGMGHPAGFGHLNGSPAQLVWPQHGIHTIKGQRTTGSNLGNKP